MSKPSKVDYSKWDKLELSDDEDFECHPNVDKKSMVRWKQAQIHKERIQERDKLELLQLEHATTARFLSAIPLRLEQMPKGDSAQVVSFLVQLGQEGGYDQHDTP